jgi:hypothetical protein
MYQRLPNFGNRYQIFISGRKLLRVELGLESNQFILLVGYGGSDSN